MEKKLAFGEILSNGFSIGLKNFLSLLGCLILWILTIWIPYLNVGTTIAIATLPAALSRGQVISPLEIFDKKYLKFMGEYFLVQGLLFIIILPAMFFMVIPAIVLSIAYSLATLLVVDKGKGASEAIKLSNTLTYGNKWTMFFANLVLVIPLIIPYFNYIYIIVLVPIMLGVKAYIYKELASDVQE